MKSFIQSRIEWLSVLALVVLLVVMGFIDPIAQSQDYHHFIDTRSIDLGGFVMHLAAVGLSLRMLHTLRRLEAPAR